MESIICTCTFHAQEAVTKLLFETGLLPSSLGKKIEIDVQGITLPKHKDPSLWCFRGRAETVSADEGFHYGTVCLTALVK